MTGYVLDGCTLINLYCGWGDISGLKTFPSRFSMGAAAASEILYARAFDGNGTVAQQELNLKALSKQYPISVLKPSMTEVGLMVRLARWLDDGEAEGLAIASIRGLVFCSDDGAVHKAAVREGLQTKIVSTPELLQLWGRADAVHEKEMPGVIQRITQLGKFTPSRASPHFEWWFNHLSLSTETEDTERSAGTSV